MLTLLLTKANATKVVTLALPFTYSVLDLISDQKKDKYAALV